MINTTIYKLPSDANIVLTPTISFDEFPSPKLIKYGFNKTTDKFDIIKLSKNEYYKVGLNIDYMRKDHESIATIGKKLFGVKVDHNFCVFWEIMNLFGMLNLNQIVLTNIHETINDIFSAFNKLTKKKLTSKVHQVIPPKENYTLSIHQYSSVELSEDVIIQFILSDLSKMKSKAGSSIIFQIFSIQTEPMIQLITYLSSLYDGTYLIKPSSSIVLSDEKYLILAGLKKDVKLFDIPKFKQNLYISSLNISVPNQISLIIQCINSELIPQKYETYTNILTYLSEQIYEGAKYQDMYQKQNDFIKHWIDDFTKFDKSEKILDDILDRSSKVCETHKSLHWI